MVERTAQSFSLQCLIRESTLHEGVPLLVLLHGYGSNEEDLFDLAKSLPKELLVISVRAPKTLAVGQYSWFDIDYSSGKPVANMEQADKARLLVKAFLEEVVSEFPVDRRRVFLGGFSQGGILSLSVGLTFPELLRGIIPMSGRVVPQVREIALSLREQHTLKVFLAHGTLDQVIPVRFAHDAHELLESLNITTDYHEYPIPHTISRDEVNDIREWISLQMVV